MLCPALQGWLSFATPFTGWPRLFPGIDVRVLTLTINFRAPFLREYLLLQGVCERAAPAAGHCLLWCTACLGARWERLLQCRAWCSALLSSMPDAKHAACWQYQLQCLLLEAVECRLSRAML